MMTSVYPSSTCDTLSRPGSSICVQTSCVFRTSPLALQPMLHPRRMEAPSTESFLPSSNFPLLPLFLGGRSIGLCDQLLYIRRITPLRRIWMNCLSVSIMCVPYLMALSSNRKRCSFVASWPFFMRVIVLMPEMSDGRSHWEKEVT